MLFECRCDQGRDRQHLPAPHCGGRGRQHNGPGQVGGWVGGCGQAGVIVGVAVGWGGANCSWLHPYCSWGDTQHTTCPAPFELPYATGPAYHI